MAIPLIPIILAVAGLASGVAQGVSSVKQAKSESKSVQKQAYEQITERARQAKKLMSEQKTSFLKSGVYFQGTPEAVINETYNFANEDINAIAGDANTKIKNLMRQGKTAFYTGLINGMVNGATAAYSAKDVSFSMNDLKNAVSNTKNNVSNWYNSKREWTRGGFGPVQTSNTLPGTSPALIA